MRIHEFSEGVPKSLFQPFKFDGQITDKSIKPAGLRGAATRRVPPLAGQQSNSTFRFGRFGLE
jgi:hypothetical protein